MAISNGMAYMGEVVRSDRQRAQELEARAKERYKAMQFLERTGNTDLAGMLGLDVMEVAA